MTLAFLSLFYEWCHDFCKSTYCDPSCFELPWVFRNLQVCLNGLKVAMSSFAESEAVFKDRVISVGLDGDILKALNDAGFKTLSKFAFSSSYTPGAVDEDKFNASTACASKARLNPVMP